MKKSNKIEEIESKILGLVEEFYEHRHKQPHFVPGISEVPVSGKVFDSHEIKNLVSSSLDFWLTDGDYSEEFSLKMSKFLTEASLVIFAISSKVVEATLK